MDNGRGLFTYFCRRMWFIRLIGRLPMPVLYFFSSVFAFLLTHVIGYRKKVIRTNLQNSFPDASTEEITQFTREFYARFTDYIVETLHATAMGPEDFRNRSRFSMDEESTKLIESKQPYLMLSSHVFNWEWILLRASLDLTHPFAGIYQRLTNPKFDKFMIDLRESTGARMIEKNDILRILRREKENLNVIAILADQTPLKSTSKVWTQFMNQETAFFKGPQMVAYLTGMHVVYMDVTRVRRGKYELRMRYVCEPPAAKNDDTLIHKYAELLEESIRRDPPCYLWSHRRWKLKRETN